MFMTTGFLKERGIKLVLFGHAEVVILGSAEVQVVILLLGPAEVVIIIKTLNIMLAKFL